MSAVPQVANAFSASMVGQDRKRSNGKVPDAARRPWHQLYPWLPGPGAIKNPAVLADGGVIFVR
jgi:hypothetical protein